MPFGVVSRIDQAKLLQVSSEVGSERDRRGLDGKHGVFRNLEGKKGGDVLGRMYTPLYPDFPAIMLSIPCSASRFVSIYRAGMRGLNMSSAEM